MELIMMLPQNKPPFIGLVHENEKMAISNMENYLTVGQNETLSLKVSLDEREPKLFVLIDFKQQNLYLKIKIDQDYAVAHYRKFETADVVNFGPIMKRNGKFSPVWSPTHNKWIVARVSKAGFYFRRHL